MSTESQNDNDVANDRKQSVPEEAATGQSGEAAADEGVGEDTQAVAGEGAEVESGQCAEQSGTGRNELQEELERTKEELLRAHADMQNQRRRAERDIENAHKFALDKFVSDLLPVVDNLERAIAAIDKDDEAFKSVSEGVELTLKSFVDVLRNHNVEQVDPKGEIFDPDKHQAMTMVPNPDLPANTVMDVFQKGYLLNGRLVRPAMVVVSKAG